MERLKFLREKMGSILESQKELQERAANDNNRLMTEDEERQWDEFENEFKACQREVQRIEKMNSEALPVDPAHESNEQREKKYTDAFERYVRFGEPSVELRDRQVNFRTTQSGQTTTTTAGGYLVPTGFGDKLVKQLALISEIRNWATVYTTNNGQSMPFPTVNDTSNKGRILSQTTQATQTLATFGTKQLDAYLFHSDIVPVQVQLVEDSAFNIEQLIVQLLGERVARGEDYYFILGNGSTEPNGVETAATTQGSYMAKTAITRLTLLDLIYSINAALRGVIC